MKKELNSLYLDKKGFSLLESIISLLLISIFLLLILSSSSNLLNLENKLIVRAENKQDLFYILECLDLEFTTSSKIYRSDIFKDLSKNHPDNMGLVFMKHKPNPSYSEFKYNYSSYYIKNNLLRRIAYNTNDDKLPINKRFSGHNLFMKNVLSLNSNMSSNDEYLILNIKVGDGDDEFFERKKYIFLKNKGELYE